MVWSHLAATSVNVAYAIVGIFAILFSLVSLPIKERLYIGEASVATIAGVIFGPFCLKWFIPTEWGTETVTLQISRIVLCIQIFAVAVELPKKYMKKHWFSVFILLVPVMTAGWLVIGLFTWIIFKPLNFSQSLLVAACITATDPVLAAAVVGRGKFAQKVPGHLRNLLSAESGCNDGMAFPFIFLSMNLILHAGNAGEIVKDWLCVTVLYECIFGCVLGAIIGWLARRAITLAEKFGTIDRESFLAFYVMLAFGCAGLGSVLGVDELLVAFAAGAAFSWNGQYAKKTDDAHVSTAIDLLLNLSYFVYLGALLPWNFYHRPDLGLPFWKYLILAIVTIFLRRIPAVMALWKFTPDLNTWREALFAGHFGPIGVGAIYAVILARSEIEEDAVGEVSRVTHIPEDGTKNYYLILYLWPVVTFLVVASIVIHGSSVAVIVFGRRLRTMSISMTFTQTQGNANSQSWMSRLPRIDTTGRSFSMKSEKQHPPLSEATTIETSGVPARPAGGARRRRRKFKKKGEHERRERPKTENLDLNFARRQRAAEHDTEEVQAPQRETQSEKTAFEESSPSSSEYQKEKVTDVEPKGSQDESRIPTEGYQEGHKVIIDDQNGEVMDVFKVEPTEQQSSAEASPRPLQRESSVESEDSHLDLESATSSVTTSENIARRRKHHLKPIQKVRSNAQQLLSGSGSGSSEPTKYIAYRVRDEIIIEDREGEILKRYMVRSHHKEPESPSTPTLRQRALSLVGFKPNTQKAKDEYAEEGGSTAPVLIPETGGITQVDNALLRTNDNKIQKKLLHLISNEQPKKPTVIGALAVDNSKPHEPVVNAIKTKPSGVPPPQPFDFAEENSEDSTESESEYETEDEGDEDEVEEETEIERNRRLNALGVGTTERDEGDEEDEIPGPSNKDKNNNKNDNDTDNKGNDSHHAMKLKWHLDV